jgi:hypothetical protein
MGTQIVNRRGFVAPWRTHQGGLCIIGALAATPRSARSYPGRTFAMDCSLSRCLLIRFILGPFLSFQAGNRNDRSGHVPE